MGQLTIHGEYLHTRSCMQLPAGSVMIISLVKVGLEVSIGEELVMVSRYKYKSYSINAYIIF